MESIPSHGFCINCGYPLRELTAGPTGYRCPECGRAFDAANPRKGGAWKLIEEKKRDGTPEDAARHDPSDELAAMKLALEPWPGSFGVFYENNQRPTKNKLEADLIARAREKTKGAADLDLLKASFARLR